MTNATDIEWVGHVCNSISSYRFRKINQAFESKAILILERQTEINEENQAKENDPDHIKKKEIYPTVQDLKMKSEDIDTESLALIVNGPYPSIEDYAKRLFILTREDFMRPLRDGIRAFMENKIKEESTNYKLANRHEKRKMLKRITDINVYEAEPLGASKSKKNNNGSNFKLKFTSKRKINWDRAKCLMHGSLLVLTCDNFGNDENLVIGVVAGLDNVKKGILEITIMKGNIYPGKFKNSFYIMINDP